MWGSMGTEGSWNLTEIKVGSGLVTSCLCGFGVPRLLI